MNNPPPHNIQMEESLLSAAMVNPDTLDDMELLKPGDFYKPAHQAIFSAILSMVENDVIPDIISVSDELKKMGKLEMSGGSAYLARLIDVCPVASNVNSFAVNVSEKAVARRLLDIMHDGIAKLCASNGDALEAVEVIKRKIFDVEIRNAKDALDISSMLKNRVDDYEKRAQNPGLHGILTGFRDLDWVTGGIQDSDLVIFAARPGMGKTSFMTNMALNTARAGQPSLIFSLEMSWKQIIDRMVSSTASINSYRFRNGMKTNDWGNFHKVENYLHQLPIFCDDTAGVTAQYMEAKTRKMIKSHGIKVVYIDYLQYIPSMIRGNENERITDTVNRIKEMAKRLDIPVILLSQLKRLGEKSDIKKARPTLSDLRGSGSIEQGGNIIAFIHRQSYYIGDEDNKAEIIVAKNRDGATRTVDLAWRPEFVRFENLNKGGYRDKI